MADFIRPTPNDLIRDGADAITNNADAAAVTLGLHAGRLTNLETVTGNLAGDAWIYRGNLPAATDIDMVRGPAWEGVWDISPADVTGMLGTWPKPPNFRTKHYGSLLVFGRVTALNNVGAQILSYPNVDPGTGEASLWYRSNQGYNTFGAIAWTEWRRLDNGADVANLADDVATLSGIVEDIAETSGGPGGNAGVAHVTLRDRFVRARGGRIGTNGKAAVAIRWDHNPDTPIANGVVDLHRDRGIPWGWAHYSRQLGDSRHTTSWATLENYALDYGAEVWGHGATHLDATDPAGYVDELATSRAELQAAMPSQLVDCFALPGVGGTNMGSFTLATRPEAIYDTPAGRIAAENYAIISGQVGAGVPYPLTGQPADLMAHLYIQAMTGADVIARIEEAQERGEGLQLMLHPNWIGAAGGISTADYTAVLDYLRDERDAGRLAVPSLSGLHLCDAGSSYRHDLARNATFADGLTGWSGTGWTVAGGVASGSSPLTQDLNMTDLAWARGACRETVLEVRAVSGTATVALIRNGATVANVSVDTDWTTIRRTTYLSMTRGTDTTTVSPSAPVEVRACHLYAN